MASIGPVPVPAALEPALPYLKFIVTLAALVATVLSVTVATPPGWVFIVIAVATALGVYVVPNSEVKAVLSDGIGAYKDAEAAYADASAGNYPGARVAALDAVQSGEAAVKGAETVVVDLTAQNPFRPPGSV
jgi:hypothetical protein